MKIILASASPRRRELLEQIGLDFEVRVSNVEEKITSRIPGEMVEELSRQKAYAVLRDIVGEELQKRFSGEEVSGEDRLIIGADTVVAYNGQILGKPHDEADAKAMLKMLSGATHQVYTGVTLIFYSGNQKKENVAENLDSIIAKASGVENDVLVCRSFHERTDVTFFDMSAEEIAEYVSSKDCMDKAGSYGIQGFCARYISGIQGDYNNVVGLPVGRLYQEIKEWKGQN